MLDKGQWPLSSGKITERRVMRCMKKNMLIYIFSFIIATAHGGPVWVITKFCFTTNVNLVSHHLPILNKNNSPFQDMSKEMQLEEVIVMAW